jgi:hypothetical protein
MCIRIGMRWRLLVGWGVLSCKFSDDEEDDEGDERKG